MGSLGVEGDEIVGVEKWSWCASKLPLLSLNHVSFVCKSVSKSARFYEDVLGFVLIKRPSSFNFEGAWLFNYGIGIHLLEVENIPSKNKAKINPKGNHISFQCSDIKLVVQKLEEMEIEYVTAIVEEGGVRVDQLFFHDPDGYMIEICNCENLPVLPISSCPLKLPKTTNIANAEAKCHRVISSEMQCSSLMMDNLLAEMMNILI
ncbi:hypothetical protein UlMin_030506 [Ulmus minor]